MKLCIHMLHVLRVFIYIQLIKDAKFKNEIFGDFSKILKYFWTGNVCLNFVLVENWAIKILFLNHSK